MTFHAVHLPDTAASCSPVRLADAEGREVEWANRFLDFQRVRGLQPLSLRSYTRFCISSAGGRSSRAWM
jgi:hypothetical protein